MKTLLFLSVVLVFFTFTEAVDPKKFQCTKESPLDGDVFSDGDPPVNMVHIFCGQIIETKAEGFHSHPGGKDPDCAEAMSQAKKPANDKDYAEYNAVNVLDGIVWVRKTPYPTSFWPTSMSIPDVVAKIQSLYKSCEPSGQQNTVCIEDFFLSSSNKFDVEIQVESKKVTSAYPRATGHCNQIKNKSNVKTCKFSNRKIDEL